MAKSTGKSKKTEEDSEKANHDSEKDIASDILKAMKKGASSKTAIKRETGLKERDILNTLDTLIEQGMVIKKKAGRLVKYHLSPPEPGEEYMDMAVKPGNDMACQYCQKPMRDTRTLKIHERNCKDKQEEDDKKFRAALLEIKDEFEDEREEMEQQFRKKEDELQQELDEMRTVLRMEIDRHRKELERIRKVEKEVAAASEQREVPEATVRPPGPKAIDKVPVEMPDIPRKADILEDVDNQAPAPEEPVRQENAQPQPVPAPEGGPEPDDVMDGTADPLTVEDDGLSKNRVRELVIEVLKGEEVPVTRVETEPKVNDELERKLRTFIDRMDSLENELKQYADKVEKRLERFEKESNVRKLQRELDKLTDNFTDMMEDTGFGEELSVAKIPPTILEIVYQATLDDIHREIVRTKGAQDAEKISRSALEEVRLKTSGSELFKFDGRKIVTDNLAGSIEANLISAKQIQTTYSVLLDKLLEAVPHHKAKNFKGMIKVKSQEFAVDRATILTKEHERMEKIIESTSQMIAAISAQFNSRNLEVNETLKDIRENLLESKADKEQIEQLKDKLRERDDRLANLSDELSLLKAEVEMKKELEAKEKKEAEEQPKEEVKKPGDEEKPEKEEPKEDDKTTENILKAVYDGASSKTAIKRETGLKERVVLDTLDRLTKDNKVVRKKAGKRITYHTPEKEMEEKVKQSRESKKKPKKKKKEDKPEKKTGKKKSGKKEDPGKKKGEERPEDKQADELPKDKEPGDEQPTVKEPGAEDGVVHEPKDELPVITKTLDQLSDDEKKVRDSMDKDPMSISGIQSSVGKGMKRFALLRALRVLIDSGYVEIIKKGRMDLYKKVNVKKMDTKKKNKTDKEVK